MAKIPTSAFNTRISLDVPRTPTRSIASAGIVEQAQTKALTGAAEFAEGIAKRRALSERDAFSDKNSIDFALDSQNIIDKNKQSFSGENTKGLTEATRLEMEENLNKRLSEAPSSDAGRAFERQAKSQMQGRLTRLQAFENQKISEFNRQSVRDTTSNIAYSQFQAPDPIEAENLLRLHTQNIDKKVGNDFTAQEGALLKAEARLKVASGTIFAMMRNGEHQKAAELVQKNYLGAFDEKSAEKMLKTIQGKAVKATNDEIRLLKETERLQKKEFKDNEEKLLQQLYIKAASGENVEAEIIERVRNKEISPGKLTWIRREIMSPNQRETDDKATFNITQRLTTGEDIDEIREDVINATNSGQMSTKNGAKMLKTIEQRKKRLVSNPLDRRKLKLADQMLKGAFPTKTPIGGVKIPEAEQELVELIVKRDQMVEQGADPIQATRALIKQALSQRTDKIPVVPSNLQDDPSLNDKSIRRIIRDKLKRKEINKQQAVKYLERHKAMIEESKVKDELDVDTLLQLRGTNGQFNR